jgi:hypothetical protein
MAGTPVQAQHCGGSEQPTLILINLKARAVHLPHHGFVFEDLSFPISAAGAVHGPGAQHP